MSKRGHGDLSGSVRRQNVFVGGDEAGTIEYIPIASVVSEGNPRKHFDKARIEELAASIESTGLLHAIVVRKRGDVFHLISGERRLRAFKHLKRQTIPAVVKTVDEIDPAKIPEAKLVENIQREDLTPGELAVAVHELVNRHGRGGQAEVARLTGKTKSWVSEKVRHAELLARYPEADKIGSYDAANIARHPEAEWGLLVQKALAGGNARAEIREKRALKKQPASARVADPAAKIEKDIWTAVKKHPDDVPRIKQVLQRVLRGL